MLLVRFLFLSVLAALTAGCVMSGPTQAQLDVEALVERYDLAVAKHEECVREARASFRQTPTGKRVMAIIVLAEGNDPQLIEKMSIDRYATEQEKTDLLETRASYLKCNEQAVQIFYEIHPAYGNLYARFLIENDELRVQVLQDEITIGELNRAYNRQSVERAQEWEAVWVELSKDFDAWHNAEMQRRAEARREFNASLEAWHLQQQIINSQSYSSPIYTNCTVGTYSVNCTSY